MKQAYKIGIAGIGGVGGYIGGILAEHYKHSNDVQIVFIARGVNAETIKDKGLMITTNDETRIVHPSMTSNNTEEIGTLDLLICCTKSYDLEKTIDELKPCIGPHTIILPLLNGVDSTERISARLEQGNVIGGCIYIVSKLTAPGVVEQSGAYHSLHIGGDEALNKQLAFITTLLKNAGINTTLEDDIAKKLWTKFSFISPVATYTSANDISIGKILDDIEHRTNLTNLMTELTMLAEKCGIELPADIVSQNLATMQKLPYEATSSMQSDFAQGKQTEIETLTGYVIKYATQHKVPLPLYQHFYERLNTN